MTSKYFFSLESIKPQKKNALGALTYVTANEMPGLVNMSFAHLSLYDRGSVEPLWHPNANKIGYCTKGNILVTMRTPSEVVTFTVKKGELFFIPQGYVHHIENIGETESVVNFALNHALPETMFLSTAVHSISENVFTGTFNTSQHFIDGLNKAKNHDLIKTLPKLKKRPENISSPYKFDIEESDKVILTQGGYLQIGTKPNLPMLEGLGILGFGLNPKGIVEPHWHTNAGELVYIVKGETRITVLSPNGHVEILDVKGGEGAFAPASHFHNIENIGSGDVEVIAFFSHAEPDYIGIGEVMGACSNDLLASVFNTTPDYFETLKKPQGPLIIVPT